ncbi:YcjF family protein [Thalassotalea maritima]|uniref:YcjF family protein n=1 Tax=Thalassotalea maritima TaxID=3242416 RepID=UPI003527766F
MSNKTEFEQHIIIGEEDELTRSTTIQQPVILPEQAWQEVEQELVEDEASYKPAKLNWLWRLAGASLAIVIVYELLMFFIDGFSQSPLITSIYGLVVGCVGLLAGKAVFKEWRALRKFRQQQTKQAKASAVMQHQASIDAQAFCQSLNKQYVGDHVQQQIAVFEQHIDDAMSDKEVLQIYSKHVLSEVDKQALAQISKYSTEAVVMVAVSPLALLDMALLLWRNLRMIDKVAGLYGVQMGYWSRIGLLRQVLANLAYAGVSEIIADVGIDVLGAEALGRVSTRAAQGLGAGMLTARLGLKAMHLSRPIPFDEQQPAPKLKHVRRQLLGM